LGSFKENMLEIWKKYHAELGEKDKSAAKEPADLRDIANWAIKKKLWAPRPVDVTAGFAREMADVLREQVRTDKDGRHYRAFIPAREKGKDGLPLFRWADIDVAPRAHVEKGIQGERRSIAADCFALAMKIDHYNAMHPSEEPLQGVFNFEDDVAEMKIAKGLEDEEAA
jgi:hypothetical protein